MFVPDKNDQSGHVHQRGDENAETDESQVHVQHVAAVVTVTRHRLTSRDAAAVTVLLNKRVKVTSMSLYPNCTFITVNLLYTPDVHSVQQSLVGRRVQACTQTHTHTKLSTDRHT